MSLAGYDTWKTTEPETDSCRGDRCDGSARYSTDRGYCPECADELRSDYGIDDHDRAEFDNDEAMSCDFDEVPE